MLAHTIQQALHVTGGGLFALQALRTANLLAMTTPDDAESVG